MLSPASLRVCCLAVMAPALTKADRQADCLPVVLSESFCVPKASDTYNITARISENTSDYSHNKRKPFMHRACWRTQKSGSGILCKYRTIGNDTCKSLLFINRVRTQTKYKTWQSTKATTAYAGKIKLKYTMNKNTSNIKNMGLAKANTSLGLQRKLKRFSKENQSSGPINVMDDSLNFSDSADSPVQMAPLITDITNSDCDVPLMDNDSVPCVSNHGRISSDGILNIESETVYENTVSESMLGNDTESFLSAGADVIEAMDTANTSVTLTDLLKSTTEDIESSKSSQTSVLACVPTACAIDVPTVDAELSKPQESTVVLEPQECNSDVKSDISEAIPLQPSIPKQESNSIFTSLTDLKLPILNNKYSGSPPMASSLFSVFNSSIVLTNATSLFQLYDKQVKCPVISDSRFGMNLSIPARQEKSQCCSLSSQELESLTSTLAGKATNVSSAVSSSARLLTKYLSAHIKKQIGSFVEHYQRNLQIPCQRPAKHAITKSIKYTQDAQTEILQSEAIKHLSTAELVKRLLQGKNKTVSKCAGPGTVPEISDEISLFFDPDDCEDIKQTSGILLSAFKGVLKESDPYLTETSEASSESDSDEETASETETTEGEDALWKYLMHRTKVGSRSTWLLSRVHELEFRIKEYSERYNELVKTEGNVSLEEPSFSLDSLSIVKSEDTDLQTHAKQMAMKNFFLPLNGFLDRSDASHIARDSFKPELDSIKLESDVESEICCRTRPLNTNAFRKRKIVVIPGLHATSPKFFRLSTVNCTCNSQNELAPCILCTGQYHSVQSVDPESMALRDRIAILDPYFHPALSTEKDIPLCLNLENVLKTDSNYNKVRPLSPEPNPESNLLLGIKPKYSDLQSHRKLRRYARTLSAKYRNKHHRTTKHLRKHKLVFGKWRRLHHKHTLRARSRFRRQSVVSSGSSDSPVNSPMSVFDDGYENRKRRDDSQFDIDDVIIPCSSRSGRLVEIQYKEIMIPSWRSIEDETSLFETTDDIDETEENITDSFLTKRHDMLVIEEKEKVKRTALGLNRRMRRNRCDSRADSSGANTPDPTSLYNNQDNVFQIPNFITSAGPASPASPPATPNSAVVSDDSQPSCGNGSIIRPEKKKITPKRTTDESTNSRSITDFDEVPPFEPLQFPLADELYKDLLAESDHNREIFDMPSNTSSFPASPISSSSSTSTVEDEDEDDEDGDATDPEWTVVKSMRNCPEQPSLVLKFAKR